MDKDALISKYPYLSALTPKELLNLAFEAFQLGSDKEMVEDIKTYLTHNKVL